jgi:transposase, IS5 family
MIPARRWQMSFADGFIAEQVDDLWEPWMRHADQALNEDQLLEIMQAAWSKLCKRARRAAVPAPRLRSSCASCCSSTFATGAMKSLRERCANLVYREFTRIGGGKVPDDKSISRLDVEWDRKSSSNCINGS